MSQTVLDTITLRPVDPGADIDLLFGWVTEERASFWGMRDKPREEVLDIYHYIQDQPHLAAYLVSVGDAPLALFQTYDPAVDEIGEFYDRRPGDVGVHLLIGPGRRDPGVTAALIEFLMGWVFSNPDHQRVVFEPDAGNEKSVAFMARLGAELGPVVDLPGKQAQFGFLDRPTG